MFLKKFFNIFKFKTIILLLIFSYIFFKISDGSEKIFLIINKINIFYCIITVILVFILTVLTIYLNMIIYKKFVKKININFFFYSFIKSQILSYVYSLVGIIYRYYIFKNRINLVNFIRINIFIIWFFLFFYLILYSFEILFFGFSFFPINFYIFVFLIFMSILFFLFPKVYEIFNLKFLTIFKKIINKFIIFSYKKKSIYNYFSIKFFLLGFLNHLISFLQIFFIFKMLNIDIQFNNIVLIFIINSLLDQFPVITPKNLGVSEVIFGFISELIGMKFDTGVLFKFFLRFFNLFSLVVLFFLFKFKDKFLFINKFIK